MSVSVKGETAEKFNWNTKGDLHTLKNDASIILMLDYRGERKYVKFSFAKGFKCDGLSVPRIFRWFLKSWDEKNDLYNLAGVVHDALYGNKGFGLFTRDESDAIFRGLLRDAGCNRFHASTADFALGLAAKSHWGDDNLETAKYATCEEI